MSSSAPSDPPHVVLSVECEPGEHGERSAKAPQLDDETFERAAAFFRAAGEVSRLKLLARLAESEWCVTELAEAAGVGLSTVSQQLRLLRAERLVRRRRAGKHIYYALTDTHIKELVQSALAHAQEKHAPIDDLGDG